VAKRLREVAVTSSPSGCGGLAFPSNLSYLNSPRGYPHPVPLLSHANQSDPISRCPTPTTPFSQGAVLTHRTVPVCAAGGFLHRWGVIDFAGGIVIHVSAGAGALVVALFIGQVWGLGFGD